MLNWLFFFILIILWEILSHLFNIPTYIFPSPESIGKAFLVNHRDILANSLITLTEIIIGFLVANLVSVTIVFVTVVKKELEYFILPLAILLKTVPIIAITPILILWLGPGISVRVATSALICFFPSLVNMLRGAKSIDNDLWILFKIYNADLLSKIRLLVLPSSMPYLFASLKISSSLAVVGALVGEFIGANNGLGFLIIVNYYNLNIPLVFASILLSSLIGIILYYTIYWLEVRLVYWTSPLDNI